MNQIRSRMTKQRSIIIEELCKVTSHPTADELYNLVKIRLPKISLGTIYRNLDVLTANGDILLLEYTGQQKRFDGNIKPHFHARCLYCNKVEDIHHKIALPNPENIPTNGFSITQTRVEFAGTCKECSKVIAKSEQIN